MSKTSEEIQKEKDMQYMRGKPTRTEVANYTNSILENRYMPIIMSQTEALKLGLMVIQGILISKGICTEDELKDLTNEFLKQQESQKFDEKEFDVENLNNK